MKTSLVFACVLAGVAIDVIAYRINSNANQQSENSQQLLGSAQGQSNDELLDLDSILLGKVVVERFNDQFNKYLSGDNTESGSASRAGQNVQYDEFDYGSAGINNERQQLQLKSQNRALGDIQSNTANTGLTMKMAEKIVALQKIANNHYTVAGHADYLNSAMIINKNVVKMPEQEFVNFYDTTMKNLNNGNLDRMYINPSKDVVYVQYKFNRVEAQGLFKSDVKNAKRGHFTVVLNKVHSNATIGFEDQQNVVVRPAQYEYADVDFKTENGVETRAFDDALEHKYMRVLTDAVTGEVVRSVNNEGVVAQIKNEIRKPIVMASRSAANTGGKLFDLRWEQDDVAMEMSNIGFRNLEQAAEQLLFTDMFIERQSENTYRTRYTFTLNDLEWTSPLTVVSDGNRMTARNVHCEIKNVKIQVTVIKSLDRPQSYGKFNTNVNVTGLRYNLDNNNAQSELVSKVENQLQRFIEQSLESKFQDNMRQQINYGRNY